MAVKVGEVARASVLSVGPDHSLAETARRMTEHRVGSAVVLTDNGGPGIITERDLLRAMAEGADPDAATVETYMTANAITASPSWEAKEAARRMVEGGFRHLILLDDDGQVVGILSIRDLVAALI